MFIITKGEDVQIPVKVGYKSGKFFDLNGKTVTAKMKINSVLTTLSAPTNIEIVNAYEGQFFIKLDEIQSNNLAKGELEVDVYVDDAGDTKIFKIRKSITVEERLV